MELTRRQFLKLGGTAPTLFAAGAYSAPEMAAARPQITWTQETMTICPFDASGCGFIVYSDDDDNIINLEGDPDHPINRGSACSKGATIRQIHDNDQRLQHVLYRAPGAAEWEEKPWDWALGEIAQRIKTTRDNHWIATDEAGTPVNRTEALASVGGSALDNEECYLLVKALRSMGLAFIEHHARL